MGCSKTLWGFIGIEGRATLNSEVLRASLWAEDPHSIVILIPRRWATSHVEQCGAGQMTLPEISHLTPLRTCKEAD